LHLLHLLYAWSMKRYLDELVLKDLNTKMVVLTGPRQVGKTTLARKLMQLFGNAQYLNWDVLLDRSVLQRQSWNRVLDVSEDDKPEVDR
jgi:predicted AAA+ superfamily ATPase